MLGRFIGFLMLPSIAMVQQTGTTAELSPPQPAGPEHVCTMPYPEAAVKAHAEGVTRLSFRITTDGEVKNITIAKTSGNVALDDASLQCAGAWRYKPATRGGVPVEAPWTANVTWKFTPPTLAARISSICARARPATSPLPIGVGDTSLSFRVTPDGEITDANVVRSSGDNDLDQMALRCVRTGRVDTSILTLPAEGVPGHVDIDWKQDATPYTPSFLPSP